MAGDSGEREEKQLFLYPLSFRVWDLRFKLTKDKLAREKSLFTCVMYMPMGMISDE